MRMRTSRNHGMYKLEKCQILDIQHVDPCTPQGSGALHHNRSRCSEIGGFSLETRRFNSFSSRWRCSMRTPIEEQIIQSRVRRLENKAQGPTSSKGQDTLQTCANTLRIIYFLTAPCDVLVCNSTANHHRVTERRCASMGFTHNQYPPPSKKNDPRVLALERAQRPRIRSPED